MVVPGALEIHGGSSGGSYCCAEGASGGTSVEGSLRAAGGLYLGEESTNIYTHFYSQYAVWGFNTRSMAVHINSRDTFM